MAAIPSPRPVKPSFSVVVALIPTSSGVTPHERNVRVYLRGLGANSDIHVTHPEAFVRKQFHHPGQQNLRIGTLIGRVGVRKIITYIPQSGSTQKSITQSVESYICVTMPEKSQGMLYLYAA